MDYRRSTLAVSILSALLCAGTAMAQDAGTAPARSNDPNKPQTQPQTQPGQAKQLETVTVSGIRASLQKSLDLKRNSDSIIDAISAEDVGKFPDTNVAESLSHLPGISVDRNFGEGDKVSILGTDPALNRLLLNGQTVASTNWTSDPNHPDGRSFNYSLLTSEIIGTAEVYKTPQARIDEGSIGGTVIVNTRRPLDLKANTLTGTVSYGYNDRADKGKPNASVLYSWKNDEGTFGVLGSLMHSDRIIHREGTEIFGYQRANDPNDTDPNHQFPASVVPPGSSFTYPTAINTALFTQHRKRDGVATGIQWKPNQSFELNLTGLYVTEKFDNYNQSRYGDWSGSAPAATSVNVANGVATGGSYGASAPTYLDGYERFSKVNTGALQLRADWHGEGWNASSQIGYTNSSGGSQGIYSLQFRGYGGYNWNLAGEHPQINYNTDPTDASQMLAHGAGFSRAPSYDRERYFQADFSHDVALGPFNTVELGVKSSNHFNGQTNYAASIPTLDNSGVTLANLQGGMTGSNYLDGLSPAGNMARWVQIDKGGLKNYVNSLFTGAPMDPKATYAITEQNRAFYIQGDFGGTDWRGNVGARYIHTRNGITGYNVIANNQYEPVDQKNRYNEWLPSFNIAYDVRDDLTLRFAAAKTLARPRYQDMTPYVALDDRTHTGSSGNVDLKPYKSTNYDATAEWYFAENSLLSAEFFFRRISDYVLYDTVARTYYDLTAQQNAVYQMVTPVNAGVAKVKGVSLTYQASFGYGFGLAANYTYSDDDTSNNFPLPYNSKNSFTLTPYYEQGPWSARVTFSRRSPYFTQIGVLESQQITGRFRQLDASVSYQLNDHVRLQLDGTNLLDETYFVYNGTPSQPYNAYKNGRTYTLSMNFKL
ncbi:TonB-dependent receptor [Dyella marensis]|uniref:TonB-dependent receptor n=2 Tax=Dyella TaxID=231454 RepID=UPI0031E2F2DF